MKKKPDRITLTLSRADRDLIRKHGFPLADTEAALDAVAASRDVAKITVDAYEVEMLLGELARSINHDTDGDLQARLNELYESIEGESGL
jgi:hypothetical protein